MKTHEAAKILNCTRATVINYAKAGKIKVAKILDNGYFDYDADSVYEFAVKYRASESRMNNVFVCSSGEIAGYELGEDDFARLKEWLDAKTGNAGR